MSETRYQVVAECAYAKVSDASGVSWRLFEKGSLVPGTTANLEHLVDCGYVVKVGGDETGGVNASGIPAGAYEVEVPAGVTSTPVEKTAEQRKADEATAQQAKADAETAEKRAAAKAKLPSDGSAPDGRASKDVFVEYLVTKGYEYSELVKSDKAELVELVK